MTQRGLRGRTVKPKKMITHNVIHLEQNQHHRSIMLKRIVKSSRVTSSVTRVRENEQLALGRVFIFLPGI